MSRVHWGRLLVVFVAIMLRAAAAHADCAPDATSDQVKDCLAQDLRESDKRINAVYKLLMSNLDDTAKTRLRDEQRAWLKTRDKACSLDTKETDRERWLQAILADQSKTICVVRHTFDRVAKIDAVLKAKMPQNAAELPAAPQAPQLANSGSAVAVSSGFRFLEDGYAALSDAGHDRGQWYLELWIDRGGIARLGDALLLLSVETPNRTGIGANLRVQRSYAAASPAVLGLAIDLDNGFVYWRESGTWKGQPGTIHGQQIKLGRLYRFAIEGSSDVRELMRLGLIKVNLGDRPFEYAMPDGYRPFAQQ